LEASEASRPWSVPDEVPNQESFEPLGEHAAAVKAATNAMISRAIATR
jgi:hypothetical protein